MVKLLLWFRVLELGVFTLIIATLLVRRPAGAHIGDLPLARDMPPLTLSHILSSDLRGHLSSLHDMCVYPNTGELIDIETSLVGYTAYMDSIVFSTASNSRLSPCAWLPESTCMEPLCLDLPLVLLLRWLLAGGVVCLRLVVALGFLGVESLFILLVLPLTLCCQQRITVIHGRVNVLRDVGEAGVRLVLAGLLVDIDEDRHGW
jgi:hypothetical protein